MGMGVMVAPRVLGLVTETQVTQGETDRGGGNEVGAARGETGRRCILES